LEWSVVRQVSTLIVLLLLTATSSSAAAQEIMLDFDDFAAPDLFAEAPRFRDAYRAAGVIFEGGMEVVHEEGNFGVVGHSAPAFLAWNNTSSGNEAEEALTFTTPVSNFRFVTGSREPGTVTATAYDQDGKVVASQTVSLETTVVPVVLDAINIAVVVITATATYGMIDDIAFTRGEPQGSAAFITSPDVQAGQ